MISKSPLVHEMTHEAGDGKVTNSTDAERHDYERTPF